MFDLTAPLRALAVGLAGVALAWLWFNDLVAYALVLAAAVALAGAMLDAIGRWLLPANPTIAVRFLEWWILTPAALAAVASAIVVVVTVTLAVPDGSAFGQDTKELIGTLSTGLTAFVTAAFISWASDDKDSKLAEHIKETFRAKYSREDKPVPDTYVFAMKSDGVRWVYSDEFRTIEGWGRAARLRRARGIAGALKAQGLSRKGVPANQEKRVT
jgi:hypothetical protein